MADVLIDWNRHRLDEDDIRVLIATLDVLGYSAEIDPSTTS